jgi:hypothetical protein
MKALRSLRRTSLPAGLALIGLTIIGCGQAATPARPARPPRPAAADAGHDHGHGHDHDDHDAKAAMKEDDHHDDHAHPETLAEGMTAVGTKWTGIRTALQGGKFDEADDMVHEIGHLLEDLPELLAKAKPPADVAEGAKKAIDEIFACFEAIDIALHTGEEEAKKLDLDGLSSRIEAAMASLSGLAK